MTARFPIVFEKEGCLFLVQLADSLNGRPVIGELIQTARRTEPIELGHLTERAGEEREQGPHVQVITRGGCSLESGANIRTDTLNRGQRRLAAERSRIGAPVIRIDVVAES